MPPSVPSREAPAAAAPRRRAPLARAAAWLLPVVLVALALGFHGFDLGKYQDDYALSYVDPATGRLDLSYHPFWDWSYFHRPLHFLTTSVWGTLLYTRDRAAHALGAAAHALSAILLSVLLRRVRLGPRAAGAAALLYALFPFHAEKVFWITATSVSVGACLALWALLIVAGGAATGRTRPLAAALLGFAAVCFYEQVCALLAVTPLIALAARPPGEPLRTGLRRAAGPTAAALGACALYAALLLGTSPAGERGSVSSVPRAAHLWPQVVNLAENVRYLLVGDRGRDFVLGAIGSGWRDVTARDAWPWLAALALATLVGARAWMRCEGSRGPGTKPRRTILALAGAALFLLAWAPLLAVRGHTVELRLASVPALGLAIALGALLDMAIETPPRPWRTPARAAAGVAVLAIALPSAVALVGAQSLFRACARADERTVRGLMAAFPGPPHAAVFVPLRINAKPGATGRLWFDEALQGGLGEPWSSWAVLRHFYRRRDLHATNYNTHGRWAPLAGYSPDGAWYALAPPDDPTRNPRAGPWPPGRVFVPWSAAIPFTVARDGSVAVVRELRVERQDGDDLRLHPPLSATCTPGTPTRVFTVREPTDVPPRRDELWTLLVGARPLGPAPFRTDWHDGVLRASIELPPTPPDAPVALAAAVAASDAPRTVVFRLTPAASGPPARAVVERLTPDGRRTTLATSPLDTPALAADRLWRPLVAPLPPTCDGDVVSLHIEAITQDAAPPPFRVTPGALLPARP